MTNLQQTFGVPVICQVEHPAVTGNLQTQRYLEVQCE